MTAPGLAMMSVGEAFVEVQGFYAAIMQANVAPDPMQGFASVLTEQRITRIMMALNVIAEEIETKLGQLDESPTKHILASIWWHFKIYNMMQSLQGVMAQLHGVVPTEQQEHPGGAFSALDDFLDQAAKKK